MSQHTESIQRILRIEGVIPEKTTVWLQPSIEGRAFKCISCGGFMFYRQHRVIALVQDDLSQILTSAPLTIQCNKCGHVYAIHVL